SAKALHKRPIQGGLGSDGRSSSRPQRRGSTPEGRNALNVNPVVSDAVMGRAFLDVLLADGTSHRRLRLLALLHKDFLHDESAVTPSPKGAAGLLPSSVGESGVHLTERR